MLMGFTGHEPRTTATNHQSCLQIGGYRDLTCYATKLALICLGATEGCRMYVIFFGVCVYRVDFLLDIYNCQLSIMTPDAFSLEWKYSTDKAIDERCCK